MFHDISADMQQVMRAMEEQLARDQRSLRSVDTDVARVLSLLAMSAPPGAFLELGSSGGYSSIWLSLAARAKGVTLTTVDLDEKKVALARANIAQAGADGSVQVHHGDAFDFAEPCRNRSRFASPTSSRRRTTPRSMNSSCRAWCPAAGWSSITSPRRASRSEFIERAYSDPRVDCVLLPFPKGDLICRKC